MSTPAFCAFVSYETVGGLAYARLLKSTLKGVGLGAWVWHDDRTIGQHRDEEIANRIYELRHFVYICTDNSHESNGQTEERNLAREFTKDIVVVAFDGALVSPVLATRNRFNTTPGEFQGTCENVAKEIGRREQAFVGASKVEKDGQNLE